MATEPPADEVKRFQGCIDDLINVLGVPALWRANEPSPAVTALLEVLLSMLRLNFAHIKRVQSPINNLITMLVEKQTALRLQAARFESERRRSAEQNHFQKRVLDTIDEAVIATDRDGFITHWNRSAERLYGWSALEVANCNIMDITPAPGSAAAASEALSRLRRGEQWKGEFLVQRRDGAVFPVLMTAAPVYNLGNVLVGTVQISIDISDRRRSEEELRRVAERSEELTTINEELIKEITEGRLAEDALHKAQAELTHVARLTTMGELAASIAHELNQPLAGIITTGDACLRWLEGVTPNIDAVRDSLRRMIRDAHRGTDVLARIRTLLRRTGTEKEPLDINEVIEEVTALVQGAIRINRVMLRTELASDLSRVLGNRVQLQQVLLNLIMNGIEAMSTIEDGPRELVIMTQREEGDKVRVSVRDCGMGLDVQAMDRLFDAFYTTKPEGMGMGLPISRSIVEAHEGQLWAARNEGAGATFHFTLPIYEPGGA